MTSKSLLAAAALICGAASALHAQDAATLGAGTRVRLVTPALDPAQRIGTVVTATHDTITFRSEANPVTRSVAVSDLTSIEISDGKETHRGRDAFYGLVVGGGAGAILGAATYKKETDCFIFCATRGGDAIAGALAGGAVGTLVGAFIVGSGDKTERWVPLRKMAGIRLAPSGGGVKLAWSGAF
jgi:hypothetical protein